MTEATETKLQQLVQSQTTDTLAYVTFGRRATWHLTEINLQIVLIVRKLAN